MNAIPAIPVNIKNITPAIVVNKRYRAKRARKQSQAQAHPFTEDEMNRRIINSIRLYNYGRQVNDIVDILLSLKNN